MRRKIIIGGAAVGLLLAGVVSAANLDTSKVAGKTLAAGDVTVSGADLASVDFELDATATKLDKITMTFDAEGTSTTPIQGATVAATIGTATSTGTTDAAGTVVIDVADVAIEDVTEIGIVVAS